MKTPIQWLGSWHHGLPRKRAANEHSWHGSPSCSRRMNHEGTKNTKEERGIHSRTRGCAGTGIDHGTNASPKSMLVHANPRFLCLSPQEGKKGGRHFRRASLILRGRGGRDGYGIRANTSVFPPSCFPEMPSPSISRSSGFSWGRKLGWSRRGGGAARRRRSRRRRHRRPRSSRFLL